MNEKITKRKGTKMVKNILQNGRKWNNVQKGNRTKRMIKEEKLIEKKKRRN